MVCKCERLVNCVDPLRCRIRVAGKAYRFAIYEDFTGGRLVDTRQNFDKRGFSRAVVSDDGQHFPGVGLEIYI